ncbi:MAG: formate dehydrogenase subunit alpha [Gammaproteobacteria bacterium]|nr:formate dehydrogenase subunit alpha [Gammaproteobacteria bacterium]MBL7000013.1 formate dehydrogenase subunit alpha [Gammaproteobacteria bacterium]
MTVTFELNGDSIEAIEGESILQAAMRHKIDIPHLCYKPGYPTAGNCRACLVEIEGERVLAASCCRQPTAGMVVDSESTRVLQSQNLVLELLGTEMPAPNKTQDNEFTHWCKSRGISGSRFSRREPAHMDHSNPAIVVNLAACIQCTRCVRACRDVQVNDVIGLAGRGNQLKIVFDLDDALGQSSCVSCGECVQACPTGALLPAQLDDQQVSERQIDTVCPYCGVGCLLTYHIHNERIIHVEGRDGPANLSRLCVKGRFGFDYIHHAERLTRPLIRRTEMVKSTELIAYADRLNYFREASWDEALAFAADGLKRIRDEAGSTALAGFGSAKGSNEEAYLFQKLVRTGFGSNNVDHCTRLCHASSVAALLEGIGSGAVSNQVSDVSEAEVIVVIGAKPTVNHPVAATFIKNAVKAGKKLIYMDPYRSDLSRHASYFLQFRPDTDVPMLNALMHCILEEDLHDETYIQQHTEGFELFKQNLQHFSPEKVAPICGIPATTLREVARLYATASSAMIFWGMGISQHIHGTDNARCLIALALMTGQIGRAGTGLHPLRGQNNVQGASDVGLIPMMLPGYQQVSDPVARSRFEKLWNCELDPNPGLTVVEIMHAIHHGKIQGMYIEGENPAMSDPNLNHARKALSMLDHLVVQDIFFTETAGFADVILPASAFAEKIGSFTNTDRRVQMGRQAVNPPGEARQDLWIIQQIANRMGLDWNYQGAEDVFGEIRQAMPALAGISWQRLDQEHSLTYPLEHEGDAGTPTIFTAGFPTPDGRARFVAARYTHADELPDAAYPLIFTTGRQLEHWHTGSMTRKARVLDTLEPEPVISIHPDDLQALDIRAGEKVQIVSRRGKLTARARRDSGVQSGTVFMAFCYNDAAANLLTNEALDPVAKIPEFKYCAVKLEKLAG